MSARTRCCLESVNNESTKVAALTYISSFQGTLLERRKLGHVEAGHFREVAKASIVDIWRCSVWIEVGDVRLHVDFILVLVRLSSLVASVKVRILNESVRCHSQTLVIPQLSAMAGRRLRW